MLPLLPLPRLLALPKTLLLACEEGEMGAAAAAAAAAAASPWSSSSVPAMGTYSSSLPPSPFPPPSSSSSATLGRGEAVPGGKLGTGLLAAEPPSPTAPAAALAPTAAAVAALCAPAATASGFVPLKRPEPVSTASPLSPAPLLPLGLAPPLSPSPAAPVSFLSLSARLRRCTMNSPAAPPRHSARRAEPVVTAATASGCSAPAAAAPAAAR